MSVTYTGLVLVVTSLPFYLVVYFFQLGEVNYWKPGEGLVSGGIIRVGGERQILL